MPPPLSWLPKVKRVCSYHRIRDAVSGIPAGGPMLTHGTDAPSVVFSQPGSSVKGTGQHCRGMLFPAVRDEEPGRVSQLNRAPVIGQALDEGAPIINTSGGERTPSGEPDSRLGRALALCADDDGMLVFAVVGSDGCAWKRGDQVGDLLAGHVGRDSVCASQAIPAVASFLLLTRFAVSSFGMVGRAAPERISSTTQRAFQYGRCSGDFEGISGEPRGAR